MEIGNIFHSNNIFQERNLCNFEIPYVRPTLYEFSAIFSQTGNSILIPKNRFAFMMFLLCGSNFRNEQLIACGFYSLEIHMKIFQNSFEGISNVYGSLKGNEKNCKWKPLNHILRAMTERFMTFLCD